MPLPTEKLTKKSSKKAVRAAVSACIRQESADREQDQAIAVCLEDARKHAGTRYIPRKVTIKK